MEQKYCFVAVEFPADPNVAGMIYWYLCPFAGAEEGTAVVAPLGRHNGLQRGVIRSVLFAEARRAPYPINAIKCIKKLCADIQADKETDKETDTETDNETDTETDNETDK